MPPPILQQLAPKATIVLVRLRSLGDTVLATPAIALLRRAMPNAAIHVVMEERFAEVLDGHPEIDGLVRTASPGRLVDRLGTLRRIRALRPDLCVDMHGGSTAAWLSALSGARWRAGFAHFRHSWAYNVRVPRAQEVLGRPSDARVHTAEHHAAAVLHLGANAVRIPAARLAARDAPDAQPYAVLHAGAAYFTKAWSIEGYRKLASDLREVHGLEPVFVAGPGEDRLVNQFADYRVQRCHRIRDLATLFQGASLFVGNDSGPAHVAAAFGVPCVVVFGSSDSSAWHPWRTPFRVVETEWDCKPCPGDRCYAFDEPRCILSVPASAVSAAAADLLRERAEVS